MKKNIYFIAILFIFAGCTNTVQKSITPPKEKSLPYTQKKPVKVVPIKIDDVVQDLNNTKIINTTNEKIALVFPSSTIGKYALEATNSINTYLLYKNKSFDLTAIDIVVQNEKNIKKAFEEILEKHITKVILMITKDNLATISQITKIKNIKLYLPLINKDEIHTFKGLEDDNITFGAISYKDQFEKLLEYTNNTTLSDLYDNSKIGNILHNYLHDANLTYSKRVDDNNGQYKRFLKNNKKITNSVIILNTPIVKSSILLSAFTSEELILSKIISTQLNYTPLLFSLTQRIDRKNLVIANSIGYIPLELDEQNQLIGNNLTYNWVNYSVVVGTELLLNGNIDFFKDLTIKDNQVIYPVNLYKVRDNSFELIQD